MKENNDKQELCRCKWCNLKNIKYLEYHDKEWGIPQYDDDRLFELLILESFLSSRKSYDEVSVYLCI